MGRLTARHIPMKPTGPLGTPETARESMGTKIIFSVRNEKIEISGVPQAMKAKSHSSVQGCSGKPLKHRLSAISHMVVSIRIVASN